MLIILILFITSDLIVSEDIVLRKTITPPHIPEQLPGAQVPLQMLALQEQQPVQAASTIPAQITVETQIPVHAPAQLAVSVQVGVAAELAVPGQTTLSKEAAVPAQVALPSESSPQKPEPVQALTQKPIRGQLKAQIQVEAQSAVTVLPAVVPVPVQRVILEPVQAPELIPQQPAAQDHQPGQAQEIQIPEQNQLLVPVQQPLKVDSYHAGLLHQQNESTPEQPLNTLHPKTTKMPVFENTVYIPRWLTPFPTERATTPYSKRKKHRLVDVK